MDVPGYTPTELRNNDVVADDRPCVGCSYNLRGLRRDGACPECGALVARSMFPSLLAAGERRHIARLRLGAALLVAALLCAAGRGALDWTARGIVKAQSTRGTEASVRGGADPPVIEARFRGPEIVRIRVAGERSLIATRAHPWGSSVTTHIEPDGSVWWEASAHDPEARGVGAQRVSAPPPLPRPSVLTRVRSEIARRLSATGDGGVSAFGLLPDGRSVAVDTEADRAVWVTMRGAAESPPLVVRFDRSGGAEVSPARSTPTSAGFRAAITWIRRARLTLLGVGAAALLAGTWLLTLRDPLAAGRGRRWLRWGARASATLAVVGTVAVIVSVRALMSGALSAPSGGSQILSRLMRFDAALPFVVACLLALIGLYARSLFRAVADSAGARACALFAVAAPVLSLIPTSWPGLVPRMTSLIPWRSRLSLTLGSVIALAALWLLLRLHRRLRRHADAMRAATPDAGSANVVAPA